MAVHAGVRGARLCPRHNFKRRMGILSATRASRGMQIRIDEAEIKVILYTIFH